MILNDRAILGVKFFYDGTIHAVYCLHDGYRETLLPKLLRYYNSREAAKEILALGDISYLGTTLNHCADDWALAKGGRLAEPYDDRTLVCGDHGEPSTPMIFKNISAFRATLYNTTTPHAYLYDDRTHKWKYLAASGYVSNIGEDRRRH